MNTPLERFLAEVRTVVAVADREHGPFVTIHHAHGVLLEEMEEFWAEVRLKESQRDPARLWRELVDITAVCVRFADVFGASRADILDMLLRAPKETGNLHEAMSGMRSAEVHICLEIYPGEFSPENLLVAITTIGCIAFAAALSLPQSAEAP